MALPLIIVDSDKKVAHKPNKEASWLVMRLGALFLLHLTHHNTGSYEAHLTSLLGHLNSR